jgi:hypothetical protein
MATATTAPVIPAVYFSSPAAVFGLCTDETCLVAGTSGGGLQSLAAGDAGSILVRSGGALTFTTAPTIAGATTIGGQLTVEADGADITGTLAVTGAATVSSTLGVTGLITTGGGVTLTGGNLTTGASGTLTVGGTSTFTGAATFNGTASMAFTATSANHLTNKAYVDSVASGLQLKKAVRVATATAISGANYDSGVFTAIAPNEALVVDTSVTLVANDRILVKNQSTALQNGIYYMSREQEDGVTWVLTRATDADEDAEVLPGMFTFVSEGALNGNKGFVLTSDGPITVGTTALTFTQFSSVTATVAAGSAAGQVQYNDGSDAFAASELLTFSAGGAGLLSVNNIQALTGQLGLFAASGQEIMVGTASGQDTTGDSVAFGLSSETTAPRAIALGRDAIARVADTIVTRAIPIVSKTAAAGSGGLCPTFAASPVVFTTRAFLANATVGDLADAFVIPLGSRFFPQSGFLWCSVYTATAGTITVKLFTGADGGGTEIASFTITPSEIAQGVALATFAVTKGYSGTLYPRVTASGSSANVTLRLSIQGVLVEKEASDT